jgi:hypothetical protein
MRHAVDDKKELRRFGLLVGGIFLAIGIWPAAVRGGSLRDWAVIAGAVLVLAGLAAPRALGPVHRVWMLLGEGLGWVNTRILLGLVFFGILTPMGGLMRWRGRNQMRLTLDPRVHTYRVASRPRPGTHMRRQF